MLGFSDLTKISILIGFIFAFSVFLPQFNAMAEENGENVTMPYMHFQGLKDGEPYGGAVLSPYFAGP